MNLGQPLPLSSVPMVGPDGRATRIWLDFFRNMLARTGGVVGPGDPLDGISSDAQLLAFLSDPADPQPDGAAFAAAFTGDAVDVVDLTPILAAQADLQTLAALTPDPAPLPDMDQPALLAIAFGDVA